MDLPRSPSFRLDGKFALVTGAGRGIGLASAAALAAYGAHVTLVARSLADIDTAAAAIRARGHQADAVALDVTDLAAVQALIEERPAFDILVNNAGGNRPHAFIESSNEDFDFVFDLNVRAAVFASQAFAKRLIAENRSGSIINMSSTFGHVGASGRVLYTAAKHAVEGLTKALAVELAPNRIRVNAVAPTAIETPLTRPRLQDPEFRAKLLSKIPLGRIGEVEDLMGVIVFLASDASLLMTGSSLVVDGGWTAE
jgi:NAD(P)-dependent dehydrogenase (short-subunit alcohol dehydrogenase family)